MTVRLDHTILASRDKESSARFLAEILGLPAPTRLGSFAIVQVGDTSLSYVTTEDAIHPQHYAFLVSEGEFDAIFAKICARSLRYWADPYRRKPNQMNTWDDGRGLYFDDPNGHLLEILTRPYGSRGTSADRPHPLVAPTLGPDGHNGAASTPRAEAADPCALARGELPDEARDTT